MSTVNSGRALKKTHSTGSNQQKADSSQCLLPVLFLYRNVGRGVNPFILTLLTDWRQGFLCCHTASMEGAVDRAEVAVVPPTL